jgi:hypothetical protein
MEKIPALDQTRFKCQAGCFQNRFSKTALMKQSQVKTDPFCKKTPRAKRKTYGVGWGDAPIPHTPYPQYTHLPNSTPYRVSIKI